MTRRARYVVDRPAPRQRPRTEDPRAARRLVDRRIGVSRHTAEGLLRTVHGRLTEFCRGGRPLHGIRGSPRIGSVTHHHPIRHAGGGRFVPHLRVYGICAEEPEAYTRVASGLGGVVHLLGPVLVVADREERLMIAELAAVGMRIDIGRIRHVVSGALEPTNEIDLPLVEIPET